MRNDFDLSIRLQIITIVILQFRAAWRRVRGKEKHLQKVNETALNQTSDTCSRGGYMECSLSFEKKKKSQKGSPSQTSDLLNLKSKELKIINETLFINKNIISTVNPVEKTSSLKGNEIKCPEKQALFLANSLRRSENNYELRMFSSEANIYGKAINQIIRANSYKSNIC